MPETPERVTDRHLWNLVFDDLRFSAGEEAARREADLVSATYQRGVERPVTRLGQRLLRRWRRLRRPLAWTLGTLVAASAVVAVVLGLVWMKANDYAGYDRKEVASAGAAALMDWYGRNDQPEQLVLTESQQGRYLGREAWYLEYRRAGQAAPVCAFIWESQLEDAKQQNAAVFEGSRCRP